MTSRLLHAITARAHCKADLGPVAIQIFTMRHQKLMPLCQRASWCTYRQASYLCTSSAQSMVHHTGTVKNQATLSLLPFLHSFTAGYSLIDQVRAFSSSHRPLQRGQSPYAVYRAGIDSGELREDPRQDHAMKLLDKLFKELKVVHPPKAKRSNLTMVDNVTAPGGTNPWWAAVTGAASPHQGHKTEGENPDRPKGMYMYGGVGVGKTHLMNIFNDVSPREFRCRRIHFHEFMLDVHGRLRDQSGEPDPLRKVADALSTEMHVLCLDELFVNDVADAMILARLFERLWDRGLTLIATSNRRPAALYEGGLNRAQFVPFIQRLEAECLVHDMDSVTDYRRLATTAVGVYFVRLVEGCTNDDRLHSAINKITGGQPKQPSTVEVAMGRTLTIPRRVGSVACFTFDKLCGEALGAADYTALATACHTVTLRGLPVFGAAERTAAYRFVTLIDTLYEHRTKLLISAEAYPEGLFRHVFRPSEAATMPPGSDAFVDEHLGFVKDRTVSRLLEMQSVEYAIAHAEQYQPEMLLALQEQKEKQAAKQVKQRAVM